MIDGDVDDYHGDDELMMAGVKMMMIMMMMNLTISQTLWLKCPLKPSPRPNTSLLHP